MILFIRSRFLKHKKPAHPLDSLPVELLLQTAGYLAPSLRDTNAFLRTSRVLYHVLSPMLHRYAVRETDEYGRSMIRFAAARGNAGMLRRLLKHGCFGIDGKERNTGTTALHSAIMLGHSAAVRVLLDRGASVEVPDRRGWTAWHWAVLSGDCGITREVLHAEARLGHGGWDDGRTGMTALQMAVARGDEKIVTMMLRHATSMNRVGNECGMRAVNHHDGRGSRRSVDELAMEFLGVAVPVGMRMAGCRTGMVQQQAVETRFRVVQLHDLWYSRLI